MNKELSKILDDNISGSNQILSNLIDYCKKHSTDLEQLKIVCENAKDRLSHFAVVEKFVSQLEKIISKSEVSDVYKFLSNYENKKIESIQSIYQKNKVLLDTFESFVTISFSKTLLEIIKIKNEVNPNLKIFVLESRPVLEGRELVKKLIKLKIDTTLLVDSLMNYAVKNSQAVVIGADTILKNRNVINKIGSYPLALCAREEGKPFYVVAERSKFVNRNKFTTNFYPKEEVWRSNSDVKIINQYFEEIPSRLITKIITD